MKARSILTFAWLATAVACVVSYSSMQWYTADPEYGLSMMIILAIFGFPIAAISAVAIGEATYVFFGTRPLDWHLSHAVTLTLVTGAAQVGLGYLQWFVLAPKLWNARAKVKSRW